ncbi:MAG: FumA C-terminus/TtdB family hydratase beta subunit [Anaerolineales bacterium]|nr:FumA C-terminus/TtdB family hydratase beta subunit [Anaerolineales bacterium]
MKSLTLPLQPQDVLDLRVGDPVGLSGVMITARDAAHKWMVETFLQKTRPPQGDDQACYEALKPILRGGAIYHCGPVVAGLDSLDYRFVAAGPTTSTREEPYQAEVMAHFQARAVIGKGGMGQHTLAACQTVPFIYLHAIGGAAALIARTVTRVLSVYKLEFGVPEAMWVVEVKDFPAVVTMDAHGSSLHSEVEARSMEALARLIDLEPRTPKSA